MKHQYESLSSTEQGEAVELERPASPDTLVNHQEQATEAPATNTTSTTNATNIFASSPTPVPFPNSVASVDEVRQYIISILHDSFHVPLQEAETAASRWQGLGHRLHRIKFEELGEVLGDPYASMIQQYADAITAHYQRVNAQTNTQTAAQTTAQTNVLLTASLAIVAIFFVAVVCAKLIET